MTWTQGLTGLARNWSKKQFGHKAESVERAFRMAVESPFAFRRKVLEQAHFAAASPLVQWQVRRDPRMTLGERTRLQGVDILRASGPEARIDVGNDVVMYRSCEVVALGKGAISIGDMSTLGSVKMFARSGISVGRYVLFSFGIFIQDYDPHPIDHEERRWDILQMRGLDPTQHLGSDGRHLRAVPSPSAARPIVIEDDVWIGANVTILKGVTIGRGSIIGANSVVTSDIPPFSIAVGQPARVVRSLASDTIEARRRPKEQESFLASVQGSY
jgi:galactoside O-acetyltransferase